MDSRVARVLVANRGEIAVRVCRACRELEIGAIAVFEPADRGALHTEAADSAVAIESYLDGPGLVDAALAAGADAVHPGYGFLAENAEFAELVQRAGLMWIGPPPEAMRSLGDKVEARRLAEAAGLRVVPGYAGIDLSDATLTREAERLGDRWSSRQRQVAAAGACGPSLTWSRCPTRWRPPAAKLRPPSATTVCSWSERCRSSPCRGAAARRRAWHRAPPRRARLLGAAPPPEGDRGVAVPGRRPRPRGPSLARPPSRSAGPPGTSAPAPSSSCWTARAAGTSWSSTPASRWSTR